MKAWRRSCSGVGSTTTAAPVILQVTCSGEAEPLVEFDQPVTAGTIPTASSLTINADTGDWIEQVSPTEIRWQGNDSHTDSGELWQLLGQEPQLSPTPATPQSGLTVGV